MKRPPKKGDYRLVSKGVGLNTVYGVEIRKTILWGLIGWWAPAWEPGGVWTSRENAVSAMRHLIKDRDTTHPERTRVVATEETIEFEPTDGWA